jgi:antitoxin VapB
MGRPKETPREAKVFWTGRSQAIRLPKEFRFDTDTVLVHREGDRVVIEAAEGWPEGYLESFLGGPTDLERPEQGRLETREPLD